MGKGVIARVAIVGGSYHLDRLQLFSRSNIQQSRHGIVYFARSKLNPISSKINLKNTSPSTGSRAT